MRVVAIIYLMIFGASFAFIGPWLIYSLHKCTEKISAKVEKVESTRHANWVNFTYSYEGHEYTGRQMNVISTLKADKYKKGEEVTIYVNPQKPQRLRTRETIGILDILLGCFSVPFGLGIIKIAIDIFLKY